MEQPAHVWSPEVNGQLADDLEKVDISDKKARCYKENSEKLENPNTKEVVLFKEPFDTIKGDAHACTVPDVPPNIRLPGCPMPFKNIELKSMSPEAVEIVTDTERCKQLVARLQREQVLAVAMEGINVGKEGPLTLMQIGTCNGSVIIFDVLVNRSLFQSGRLRVLLEDSKILKVVHDCSHMSAALSFQYAVTLNNVFDTEAAHMIIEEHKGCRLPQGLKLSEICLQYSDNAEKFYTYDWRTDSKKVWTAKIGNFWALRPLTPDMVEFATGDVIVLIPDVYRHQQEYIDANKLRDKFDMEVSELLQIEIDNVVKERRGRRLSELVEQILREMDRKYNDKVALFNILDTDESNALALVTYEDAANISDKIMKLKCEHILMDLAAMELKLRKDDESWEHRGSVLNCLRYYCQLPNSEINANAKEVLEETMTRIMEHIEGKYTEDSTPNMLSATEADALLTIRYNDFETESKHEVITALYWKFMQGEIHEMINQIRFSPGDFCLTSEEYTKLEYFANNSTCVPEEVSSLSSGLLHAVRAYSAANGGYVVGERRKSGVYSQRMF